MNIQIGDQVEIIYGIHAGKIGTVEKFWPAGLMGTMDIYTIRTNESHSGMFTVQEFRVIDYSECDQNSGYSKNQNK
jgi:hypothetical protein